MGEDGVLAPVLGEIVSHTLAIVDNAALSLLYHHRNDVSAQQVWPFQIRGHNLVPLVRFDLQ